MAQTTIYFKYGAMNSGKSLELLKIAHNYEEQGIKPLILKSAIDTRVCGKVYSRIGLEKNAIEITEKTDFQTLINDFTTVILVDESQFLTPQTIDKIIELSYDKNVMSLMFFGLKNTFNGELFEGSKRILEKADKIEESTSVCWCGKKARQNVRLINGQVIKNGPTILIDNNEDEIQYITLCNYHYYKEQIQPKE